MSQLMAFCGIDCAECPAYVATQANDVAAQERLLAEWRVQYNVPDMPPEAVTCDGCVSPEGRHGGYCLECAVRACAVDREVITCAHCSDYGCEKIEGFLAHAPELRAQLEEVRRALLM